MITSAHSNRSQKMRRLRSVILRYRKTSILQHKRTRTDNRKWVSSVEKTAKTLLDCLEGLHMARRALADDSSKASKVSAKVAKRFLAVSNALNEITPLLHTLNYQELLQVFNSLYIYLFSILSPLVLISFLFRFAQ